MVRAACLILRAPLEQESAGRGAGMTDRDRFDIDGSDDLYAGENAWQARPSAGAMVAGGALFAVVVLCGVVLVAWATGWMADEVTGWLP